MIEININIWDELKKDNLKTFQSYRTYAYIEYIYNSNNEQYLEAPKLADEHHEVNKIHKQILQLLADKINFYKDDVEIKTNDIEFYMAEKFYSNVDPIFLFNRYQLPIVLYSHSENEDHVYDIWDSFIETLKSNSELESISNSTIASLQMINHQPIKINIYSES